MRTAIWGALIVTGLMICGAGWSEIESLLAQQTRPSDASFGAASAQLIALSSDSAQSQQITLIDPRTQVISVYHVDRANGEIALKSVRNIRWDLLMEEFNAATPSPREIRSLIDHP